MRVGIRWATIVAAGVAIGSPALAQQTLFNVPSADVLDRGKLYLEEDTLWRPSSPAFAIFTVRAVYGFGSGVEGGVNLGGFETPGRSVPTAVLAVKWQPVKSGPLAVTAGAYGLFFLRGSSDGDPCGQLYAHASWAFPTGTRIAAGGWIATSGYAGPTKSRGGLFTLEQKAGANLTVAADWFTGPSSIGYLSPGLIFTTGPWTVYASYSLRNGRSKGNAALIELGYSF